MRIINGLIPRIRCASLWDGSWNPLPLRGSHYPLHYVPNTLWYTYKKRTGKSPFLMGKSTISKAIFNSKLLVYQRVNWKYPLSGPSDKYLSDRIWTADAPRRYVRVASHVQFQKSIDILWLPYYYPLLSTTIAHEYCNVHGDVHQPNEWAAQVSWHGWKFQQWAR